jgi:hypothetical protein
MISSFEPIGIFDCTYYLAIAMPTCILHLDGKMPFSYLMIVTFKKKRIIDRISSPCVTRFFSANPPWHPN